MKKLFNNMRAKANQMSIKAMSYKREVVTALTDTSGEGYLDTVIKLLIAIVLGALLLAGLYALFNNVVMPRLETEVTNMFDYAG